MYEWHHQTPHSLVDDEVSIDYPELVYIFVICQTSLESYFKEMLKQDVVEAQVLSTVRGFRKTNQMLVDTSLVHYKYSQLKYALQWWKQGRINWFQRFQIDFFFIYSYTRFLSYLEGHMSRVVVFTKPFFLRIAGMSNAVANFLRGKEKNDSQHAWQSYDIFFFFLHFHSFCYEHYVIEFLRPKWTRMNLRAIRQRTLRTC